MIADLPHPMFGISRIEQPEKSNYGFYVRLRVNGEPRSKWFSFKVHGGEEAALAEAEKFRDQLVSLMSDRQLEAEHSRVRNQRRKVPKSGVKGVIHYICRHSRGYQYEYWCAIWRDDKGKERRRTFSINYYGNDLALSQAIHHREKMVKKYPKTNS